MSDRQSSKVLHRRLRLLYVAAFFHGFVFWYAIEKIFMKTIGYNDATIGIMIAFYSAIIVITETPSGILADRWSRKGVLVIASFALSLSALVGGVSDNVAMYLAAAGFWGVFFALYSGTYDSIIYDTVYETTGTSKRYEYHLGRLKVADSAALVLGSLIGGLIANYAGLRIAYFLTIPFSMLSVVALLKFREPKLHKSHVAVPIKNHIRNTLESVLKRGRLVPILVVTMTTSTLTFIVFEFGQLWTIALAAPLVLFGPINAVHLSSIGLGGMAASKLKLQKRLNMVLLLLIMLCTSLGLVFFRSLALVVGSIFILCVCLIAVNVVFNKLLHDSLDSKVRAGAASAVSTIGRTIMIPVSILFGYMSREVNVFYASWLIVGLVGVIAIFALKTYTRKIPELEISQADELVVESYNK